jgi:hypothetical protein
MAIVPNRQHGGSRGVLRGILASGRGGRPRPVQPTGTVNRTPGSPVSVGRGPRTPVGFGRHGNPFFTVAGFESHHGGRLPPGLQGGHPADGGGTGHLPHPTGPGHLPAGGYQGLGGILQILQHGINQSQLNNLAAGATGGGGTGAIGGMHGAFSGLSPAAVHYLATSGLLTQQAPQLQDTTGLQGDDLFKAQLMNSLMQSQAQQNPTYSLHSGVDAGFLGSLLSNLPGAYAKGFNATGRAGAPPLVPLTR